MSRMGGVNPNTGKIDDVHVIGNALNVSLATYLTGERFPTSSATISDITSDLVTFGSTDYDSGDQVVISGSTTTAANRTYTITKTNDTSGTLTDSTGASFTGGDGASDGTITFTHLSRGYFVTNGQKTGVLATAQEVTEADDDLVDIDLPVYDIGTVMVRFSVATNNLDQFEIAGSVDGITFDTLYSTALDYTNPSGLLIGTSGDLTSVAAASSGWYIMDCRALHTIRHVVSCTGGAGAITMKYSGR